MLVISDKVKNILWHILEAVIFLAIISCVWNYYSNKNDINQQNLKAAQNELYEVKLKNGELMTVRDSYIATIDDLEELLDISKKEVKDIQRKLDSKIAYISKLESTTRIEYIEVVRDSIIYVNNNPDDIIAPFHYDDRWLNITGQNNIKLGETFDCTTVLNEISINTPLTVGLTNDYQIFVSSPNPYLKFNEIEGAVLDKSKFRPKKKLINWGFQVGVGPMYDILDNDIAVGVYCGIGAEINF
jgi:hypothetical protein